MERRRAIILISWVEHSEKQNEMALPSLKQDEVAGIRGCWGGTGCLVQQEEPKELRLPPLSISTIAELTQPP